MKTPWLCIPLLLLAVACGDDDDTCDPVAQTGCDDGLTCEPVQDGEPMCFAPVVIRGQVFDLADDSGVGGARIVALDANGAPASSVATSDSDGSYSLAIPSTRLDDTGAFVGKEVTLRADANLYQPFPSGLRQALPIDTATATEDELGILVVQSAQTDIGMIALEAGSGDASIRGTVEVPESGAGVLVVAGAATAIADRDGDYQIFNLAPGDYDVEGYARGVSYEPVAVTLAAGQTAEVDLLLSEAATATLSGSVQLVNPGAGQATSIILVVESTFDEVMARGATPPGLRAPEPGIAPDVTGAFTIDGVPAGDYVVLAAFENDYLVRDPDTCISGTDIVRVTVAAGDDLAMDQSFKVTGALDIFQPGATGAELVAGTPTFEWEDDSGEEGYFLTVFDAYGNIIWEHDEPGHSGDDPSVAYAGPALEAGMYYQFKVVSWSQSGGGPVCEKAASEDLKGVFYVE